VQWIEALPVRAPDGRLVAVVVAGLLLMSRRLRQPIILYVFVLGFVVLHWTHGQVLRSVSLRPPHFGVFWPAGGDWWIGFTHLALAQVFLTLLNSVIAVCALSADYFPERGIRPRRMATSVALMNLVCVPLGGMPCCHGAGGLAAQYRFGARTGGSVIMLGVVKVIAGLMFGSALLILLKSYPRSILGVMLVFAGCTLAWAARDCRGRAAIAIAAVTAGSILVMDTLYGFLIGCLACVISALLARVMQRKREPRDNHCSNVT
jgi:MFS superfamily sulfate permease-like transporter